MEKTKSMVEYEHLMYRSAYFLYVCLHYWLVYFNCMNIKVGPINTYETVNVQISLLLQMNNYYSQFSN